MFTLLPNNTSSNTEYVPHLKLGKNQSDLICLLAVRNATQPRQLSKECNRCQTLTDFTDSTNSLRQPQSSALNLFQEALISCDRICSFPTFDASKKETMFIVLQATQLWAERELLPWIYKVACWPLIHCGVRIRPREKQTDNASAWQDWCAQHTYKNRKTIVHKAQEHNRRYILLQKRKKKDKITTNKSHFKGHSDLFFILCSWIFPFVVFCTQFPKHVKWKTSCYMLHLTVIRRYYMLCLSLEGTDPAASQPVWSVVCSGYLFTEIQPCITSVWIYKLTQDLFLHKEVSLIVKLSY